MLRRRKHPLRSAKVLLGVPAVVGAGVAGILARRRAGKTTVVPPPPNSSSDAAPTEKPQEAKDEQAPDEPKAAASQQDAKADDSAEPKAEDPKPKAQSTKPKAEEPEPKSEEPEPKAEKPKAKAEKPRAAGSDHDTQAAETKPNAEVADQAPEPSGDAVGAEWSCECGEAFKVSGQGRHRVFWPDGAEASDPVIGTTCPACDRPLPRSR